MSALHLVLPTSAKSPNARRRIQQGWVWLVGWVLVLFSGLAAASTTINHSFTPDNIAQGDTSRYTIEITNDSTTQLTAAKVTALLDNTSESPNTSGGRVQIATGTVIVNSCNFTGVSAAAGSSKLVLTGGTIPAGTVGSPSICSFSIDVTSTESGTYYAFMPKQTEPTENTVGFQAFENGNPVSNDTTSKPTLQVNSLSPPTGSKSFSPSPAIVGDPTTLTITLTNPNANSTMPVTSFTDSLPSGMLVAPSPDDSVSCTGTGAVDGTLSAVAGSGSIALTGATIGNGGTCTISAKVRVASISGASEELTNSLADGAIVNPRGLTSLPPITLWQTLRNS